jgi:probable rRNA maturation factor
LNTIEINIEKDLGSETNKGLFFPLSEEKIKTAVDKVLSLLKLDDKEISLYFCDNKRIKDLNNNYRHKDYITDVLSFESGEEQYLGDIAISIERADEQKDEYDSPSLDYELLRLLIHGILHLIGYDHEKNDEEAKIMFKKEKELILEVEKLTLYQNY